MLDPLTLDQLRVLVAVADAGSFSAAARRLGRVQSAVSQAVQTLETTLRIGLFDRSAKTPVLTEAGRALLDDARHLLRGAETLRARAETIAANVEPDLTLAVDPVFPNPVLMASLRALRDAFPHLPVTLFTEGLGGAEQRLREGTARLGIFPPLPNTGADLELSFLTAIPAVPVVAADHPLAREPEPLSREVLERHLQLVLTDRTTLSAGFSGSVIGTQIWRFADQGSRAGIPAGRLRLVPHAASPGGRAYRGGAAETPGHPGTARPRLQLSGARRASARPSAGPRRAMAGAGSVAAAA